MARRTNHVEIARRTGAVVVVVMYLRVSKLGDRILNDEKFHSPELQVKAIRAGFDREYGPNGWRLADVDGNYGKGMFADFDVSGRSTKRQGLDAALDAVAATGALSLGVLNLSRWARNLLGALIRIKEIESNGATLISAEENSDFVTPAGRFATHIFLAMAELFSDQKSDDWSEVIEKRACDGRHHGTPPSGFVRPMNPASGKRSGELELNPAVADLVTEAFDRIDRGASRQAVGRWLQSNGVISSPTQVMVVLTNRAYRRTHALSCAGPSPTCGRTDQHGDFAEVRSRELIADGDRVVRGDSSWYPARHTGLVDADLFDRVQSRIAEWRDDLPEGAGRRSAVPSHELVGVVRCPYCHRALAADASKGPVSFNDNSGHDIGCDGPGTVSGDRVLDVVIDELKVVVAHLNDADVATAGRNVSGKAPAKRPSVAALTKQRQRAVNGLAKIEKDKIVKGAARKDVRDATIALLEADIVRLDAALDAATRPGSAAKVAAPKAARDLVARWDEMDVAARNAALREIVTVYVARRSPGAPFRQPYEERTSIRWAWED